MAIYIGLGSNLPGTATHPLAQVQAALRALAGEPGLELRRCSPAYITEPIDAQGPDFINAVAELRSRLMPLALLARLQALEVAQQRQRPYRHAPRTLDLDMLLWGTECISSKELTVPHPRMHQRAFVLAPLADLAPDLEIPGVGRVRDALAACSGQRIRRLDGDLL